MRESHASKSIVWFFSTIGKRMKRSHDVKQESRADSLWVQATKLPFETLSKIEEETKELIDFFTETWKLPTCHQHLRYTLKWLEEVRETTKEQAPTPTLEEEPHEEETLASPPPPEKPSPSSPSPFSDSPKMIQLMEKLQLFESLIEERNFNKASHVGSDIQQTLENFDPTQFFPKLFAQYIALVAKHIDTLLMEWANKESPQWGALEKLYQTDIEAFVKW
jgi:hypothetical protein